ncbi:MAG: alpha/beta fold hydrolase [Polyangiaceae bacterium]|nr:alpha/beta fold hydrolase [Polyangiaceae bacterium]
MRALFACAVVAGCGSTGEDPPGGTGGGEVTTGSGGGTTTSTSTSTTTTGEGGSGGAPEPKLGPPYPIVLAHGFFGFEQFAGADFATYFYQVKETLSAEGEMIYTPSVDPFNDSTFRGAELAERIQQILDETGHAKVNIIGHSQGGLDARVVAHDHPDLVASVVTIGTPHQGSEIADIVLQIVSDPAAQALVDQLVQVIGAPLYDDVGNETSVVDALYQFSKPGIEAFNAQYSDGPGVFYASITGRTDLHGGGKDCQSVEAPPFIAAFDDERDPTNAAMILPESILDGGLFEFIPNDGLVRVKDAKWGHFWGCVPADHLDEVGQIFGQGPGLGNSWSYMDFYRSLVAHLRAQGY